MVGSLRSCQGAHPRSRGENAARTAFKTPPAGSSPLTRGKRGLDSGSVDSIGLIPAHAGKTLVIRTSRPVSRAHPRSRGENATKPRAHSSATGSSPLTRGKPRRSHYASLRGWLIPAHAGKTNCHHRTFNRGQAHPRSRGENHLAGEPLTRPGGSSPLTRGKPWNGLDADGNPGLIPAHAGKTHALTRDFHVPGAHPPSRGENLCGAYLRGGGWGSSPLTRGKLRGGPGRAASVRLIPAHAGKTWPSPARTCRPPAHPRSRGENDGTTRFNVDSTGSSPLTRGKLPPSTRPGRRARLIPAHAGKTSRAGGAPRAPSAHPRSRGENSS